MRTTAFFLCAFTILTGADIATTYIALGRGGHELNPFTDTSSLWTLTRPELIAAALGSASVFLGVSLLRRSRLRDSVARASDFYVRFWSASHLLGAVLVFVPVGVSLTRIMPVASNLSMLAFGFSPWIEMTGYISRRFSMSPYAGLLVAQGVLGGFLVVPFTGIIRRVIRFDLKPREGV